MSGSPIVIVAGRDSIVENAVEALSKFPREPEWVLIGGLAVYVRLRAVNRPTADVDTIARSQAELIATLSEYEFTTVVSGGNLEIGVGRAAIEVDVMDLADEPLPDDEERRAFAKARRAALGSAAVERIVVRSTAGARISEAEIPVAGLAAMVALKTVSMVRRPHGAHPAKVGSDIHDLVRLVAARARQVAGDLVRLDRELAGWVGRHVERAFTRDLMYSLLRLRRNDRSPGAQALTDGEVAATAVLAAAITDCLSAADGD